MSDVLDNNLPTSGTSGAIVVLARKLKEVTKTSSSAVQDVTTTDPHLEVEKGAGNVLTLSTVDVASKTETNQKIDELTERLDAKDVQIESRISTNESDTAKLKAFVGFQEDLDLVATINGILNAE